jgi:2',3'-cyclic-nucleotide 2'-phosphodiesterase (5'-nucleotidase family)
MPIRRTCSTLVALLLAIAAASATPPKARELTILYFNDIHGHLVAWQPDPDKPEKVGGIARMAALVERIRRENRRSGRATILLEAGDVLQGTPMSVVFEGTPDVEAFNLMKLDAMALGNHEFDFGIANLRRITALARFPVLSANVYAEGGASFARPTAILTPAPGLRVGVIGLTTADTPLSTFPTNVEGLVFDDPVAVARHAVPVLESQCDLVVALTHIGVAEDRRLAREVPGVDVVIGGHNHIAIERFERAGNAVICQAQDNGRYLGRLDLTLEGGRVASATARLIPLDASLPEDPRVARLVGGYAKRLDARVGEKIGRSRVLLDGTRANVRTRETTLGNFVADLVRDAARTEIALVNGGALRASIGAGTVTYGDVLTALPFPNAIVSAKLPGRAIREALDRAASLDPADLPGGFLQVSGVKFRIEGGRAVDVRVGGAPLDDARLYSVALPDFLLLGGDGYRMLADAATSRVEAGIVLNGLVVDYFRNGGEADARVEGRIVRVK